MKTDLVPVLKTLPVVHVFSLVETVLNHSARMSQIKHEYKLAKQDMKQQFRIQKQQLDNDLSRFKVLAKSQRTQSKQEHVERKKLLDIVKDLSQAAANSYDVEMVQTLHQTIELVLGKYSVNKEENVSFLEHIPTKMIGER